MALTVKERMKKQRDARKAAGWVEVRVWVPTVKDATDLQELAAERRALAPNPACYGDIEYSSWASK